MKTHPVNTNLHINNTSILNGYTTLSIKGGLVDEYLIKLQAVLDHAMQSYSRVWAFRVDLHLPCRFIHDSSRGEIEKFFSSFKAKIKHNRMLAKRANKYAHDTVVRYVWAKEQHDAQQPHYHVMIFLNYDAFCSLGYFELGRDNIFNILVEAWSSALSLPISDVCGLVHIPENPGYTVHRNNDNEKQAVIYRGSYLCKVNTKHYGSGLHCFGGSRG